MDTFESSHSLKGEGFGKARNVHGHTYKVELVVEGTELSKDGVLCDIVQLKNSLSQVLKDLHYTSLDDNAELKNVNTTAEEMARYVHRKVSSKLGAEERKTVRSMKITVWENQTGFASFSDKI